MAERHRPRSRLRTEGERHARENPILYLAVSRGGGSRRLLMQVLSAKTPGQGCRRGAGGRRSDIMSRYNSDSFLRLDDIEGLLVTAQGLASRLTDSELDDTKNCIRNALAELRAARQRLDTKRGEPGEE